MPTANQSTNEGQINQLNLTMRQTPWYQQFFAQRGLNPDRVKLNDQQRAQLAQLAKQNGYQLGDRMKIDEAGNINQQGGFAGMPTWAKIAIAAAPVAGAMLVPGVREATMGQLGSIFGGGGGVGAGGTGAGVNAAGNFAATQIPQALGTGGLMSTMTAAEIAALPTLGSTALTTGMATAAPSLAGSTAAGGGSVAARAGGDVISRLVGGDTLADAGSIFERFANDEAGKRTEDFNMNNRYNSDMIAAQQNRRTQETDAMKKIQQAGYIKSGGTPFDASKIKLSGGRSLPSFSFPRSPITDEDKQAAGMLEAEMLKRLGPGGSFQPKPVEDFTRRGVGEQIGRWGGVGSAALQTGKRIWDIFT